MANYDALERHLRDLKRNQVELDFDEIQRIIELPLPKAARSSAWWSNDIASNGREGRQRAWLKADFNAELLTDRKRVSFVRRGYRIVWRSADTVWMERINLSDEERDEARQAAENLIKSIGRVTVEACNKLGVTFDMNDPEVARDVFGAVIEGLFKTSARAKRRSQKGG